MNETDSNPDGAQTQKEAAVPRPLFRLAGGLWLVLLGTLGIFTVQPPSVVPETAPASEFSAERAMKHLRVIAAKPHPVGSPANQNVREYLIQQLAALDLDPRVQEGTGFARGGHVAGTVFNVFARKKGTTPGKALLLLAHYDSVAAGPGAGDDGAGVAALLETARALHADPSPLRNDVLFLFTDGEEAGLLGAAAFVADHPAAKEIGLALNFEGRGDSGPSMMFETSEENGWLIREFAAAAPYPNASSLSQAIYKEMPNDTDLSVLKQAGYAGLNFGFIGSPERYHTPQDTPENLDPRSLQHHGSHALALARRFGNLALENRRETDAIYFNFMAAGHWFVDYPVEWAVPLAVAVALLVLVVGGFGLFTGQLRLAGLALGLIVFAVSGFIAQRGGAAFVQGLGVLHRHWLPPGPVAHSALYGAALAFLATALTAAIWELSRARAKWGASWQSLAFIGLAVWAGLTVAASFYFPAASYLATWPVLFNLLALGVVFAGAALDSYAALIALLFGAAPAMLLVAPLIQSILVAFGMELTGGQATAVVVVLLLWIEAPLILSMGLRRWLLVLSAFAGLGFLCWGAATVRYTRDDPRHENVFYLLDGDTFRPVWLSMNLQRGVSPEAPPDEWAAQYVSNSPERIISGDYFAFRGTFPMFQHEAPQLPLEMPEASVLEDTKQDGKRTLRLVLRSPRHARQLQLIAEGAGVSIIAVNGKRVEDFNRLFPRGERKRGVLRTGVPDRVFFHYSGLPEAGVEIVLETTDLSPLKIKLTDYSDGLPDVPGQSFRPRPEDLSMQHFSDMTMVSKSFSL
jgi:MFS family permease